MTMKKRLLALLLAVCLVASLLPATASAAGSPFRDVKPGDWFYRQVQYVYDNNLMSGTNATTFSPYTPTNRGMVAFILYKIEGSPAVSGSAGFSDVKSQYFAKAVTWASQNKIVSGTGSGRFNPNGPVNRGQLALMLYNYAKYKGFDVSKSNDLSGFRDYGKIQSWAMKALSWANAMGLISGKSGNLIDPTGNALRGQMAVILYAFCQKYTEEPAPEPTPDPNPDPDKTHEVRFMLNYGEGSGLHSTQTVKDGQTVTAPANPSREGYTFLGWYTRPSGGNPFSFDTAISTDTTLYAQWTQANTFAVSFNLNYEGGGNIETKNVPEGQPCPKLDFEPSREDYLFAGWYTASDDGVLFDFTAPVTANVTIYAHWTYNGPNWADPYQTVGSITKYDGSNPLKNFKMMGIEYSQGLVFDHNWRTDDTEASFNLGGKYEVLTMNFGHIDNGGRADNTLYIYFDGGKTPADEITLTGNMSTEHYVLNVKGRTNLRIVRRGGAHYSYALSNMLLLTEAEAQKEGIVTPAISSTEPVENTNLASGQVLPYQWGGEGDFAYYDGSDPLKNFKMMGLEYIQGVTIGHSWRTGNSDLSFNLGKGFDLMSFTVGHVDGWGVQNNVIHVYKDDVLSNTIDLNGIMATTTYTINVQGVNKLRLVRSGGASYGYALANITLKTAADVASEGITVPADIDSAEVHLTNLQAGPVLPYQQGGEGDVKYYDGTDELVTFPMAGTPYTQGLTMSHSWRTGDTEVLFNLGNGFTNFSFTAGHIDKYGMGNAVLYVYKDGVLDESATITLEGNMPNVENVKLDVTGVNHLRIVRHGQSDYGYGMANITVS